MPQRGARGCERPERVRAMQHGETHSTFVVYLLWIFGFTGAHRFYFGKPVTGTLWFFTFGLLGVGWLVDLFLMPGLKRSADRRFASGGSKPNKRPLPRARPSPELT